MTNYRLEPITGGTILIAGLLKLFIYYKSFDFVITPFLEMSEVILLFFDNLLYFLLFFFFNILIILSLDRGVFSFGSTENNSPWPQRIARYLNYNWEFKCFAGMIILLLMICTSTNVLTLKNGLYMILIIVALYINPIVIKEFQRLAKYYRVTTKTFSIILFISAVNLFVYALAIGAYEAYELKHLNVVRANKVYFTDSTIIISNMKKYYVGKTKNFVYFYNNQEKAVEVIPIRRVDKIEY